MLILGSGVEPQIVPQEAIDAETIGDDLGILNAPRQRAVGLAAHRVRLDGVHQRRPRRPGLGRRRARAPRASPDGAFVVHDDNGLLRRGPGARPRAAPSRVPTATSCPAQGGTRDTLLSALGPAARSVDATAVTHEWLGLFPAGGPLDWDELRPRRRGRRPCRTAGRAAGCPTVPVVGDVVQTPTESLLLTAEGRPRSTTSPGPSTPTSAPPTAPTPRRGRRRRRRGPGRRCRSLDAHWPDALPEPLLGEACALLSTDADRPPVVQVATDPTDDASSRRRPGRARSRRGSTPAAVPTCSPATSPPPATASPYLDRREGQRLPARRLRHRRPARVRRLPGARRARHLGRAVRPGRHALARRGAVPARPRRHGLVRVTLRTGDARRGVLAAAAGDRPARDARRPRPTRSTAAPTRSTTRSARPRPPACPLQVARRRRRPGAGWPTAAASRARACGSRSSTPA